jgi:hypothetical protein
LNFNILISARIIFSLSNLKKFIVKKLAYQIFKIFKILYKKHVCMQQPIYAMLKRCAMTKESQELFPYLIGWPRLTVSVKVK